MKAQVTTVTVDDTPAHLTLTAGAPASAVSYRRAGTDPALGTRWHDRHTERSMRTGMQPRRREPWYQRALVSAS